MNLKTIFDMMILRKFSLLIIVIFSFLIDACGQNAKPIIDSISKYDLVSVNGKKIQSSENPKLAKLLTSLEARSLEVYSKPDFEINIKAKGEIILISVFEEEKFVYKGFYLDAWEDRMKGKVSEGYKLSKELENFLDYFNLN